MGKPAGRKKPQQEPSSKGSKHSSSSFDNDTAAFIAMSQELKEEGNRLFQKRDYETAMLRFEKALKLLPKSHIDVANLRTNMASCYMQLGIGELPRAINECNLALELAPKYTKALIRRAKCFQSLNRFDLAWKDVCTVLIMEPNNLIALEIKDSLSKAMEAQGIESECKKKVINKEVVKEETVVARTVKLVYGDDIRWAQLPINCSLMLMREIVRDRYPSLKGVLIKYRDSEGDCVTITTTDELRSAEANGGSGGSLRLYIAEVSPEQEPRYEGLGDTNAVKEDKVGSACVDAWIVEFAEMFKTQVGFDSGAYMELHGAGMKLYSEAVEDVVSSEEAQGLFDVASGKFQEMAALALLNLGNVHMSKARKRVLAQAIEEYAKAGMRYEEALAVKPDFYEGFLALGQQQFEQAKICWTSSVEASSSEALQLFNKAEDNMETGMQMWEEMEERRLNGITKESDDEASAQSKIMRAQILILWGSLLYERSLVEFKLGLPTWEECLEVAVEKFELAGASKTDIAVMVKNHCAHQTAQEGLGFKIDEIVQAWHEMYDAKRWLLGVPSFRLEPLFRRRIP